MKNRVVSTCLTVSLLCTLSAWANSQTKADITLEGPWILYVDTSAQQWPVLVLISPGGVSDDNDMTYFHTLGIDNGDGYPMLRPGVYCLTFDGSCTPKPACSSTNPPSCPSTLSPDHYPQKVKPLQLSVSAQWDWSHKWLPAQYGYATAFVLPMPDYYSTDSGWFMRFNDQFDATGTKYHVYDPKYATSLRLHYENGPDKFALRDCTPKPKALINLSTCVNLSNTDFDNIGTLHITMRSPESNNACDLHVRRAYPRVFGLLDGDNSKYRVIDLAKGFDQETKVPIWDKGVGQEDYRCLDHDEQAHSSVSPPVAGIMNAKLPQANLPWVSQLAALDSLIGLYEKNREKYPELGDKDLLLAQIKDAYQKLDTSFPRFSQAELIRTLLNLSKSRLETLLLMDGMTAGQSHDVQPLMHAENPEVSLPALYALETAILAGGGPPPKSGNDCKSPLMLVQ